MSDPVQYRQLGIRGDRPSTKRGTICSLNSFSNFLMSKNLVFANLTEDTICQKSLFAEFGDYLANYCKHSNSGELLARDTAVQYLSGVKTEMLFRFPTHSLWKENDEWYTNIRDKIKNEIHQRNAKNGDPDQFKVIGVGRYLMKKISEHLFELNTIAGIQKRFLTVDLFKSVGRGG